MRIRQRHAGLFFLAATLAAALFLAAGCGDSESAQKARKEIKEAAAATRDYAVEKRDEFVAASEKALADMNVKIDQLSDEAVALTGEAKVAAEKKLAELKEASKGAREELDRLKGKAGNAWQQFKAGASKSLDALGEAYDDAKAAFAEEPSEAAEGDAPTQSDEADEGAPEPTPAPTPEPEPAP